MCGECSATHLKKIHIFQNKVLRIITNDPWFIRNENVHKEFQINKIEDHMRDPSKNFHNSILNSTHLCSLHYNLHIHSLPKRRLKRKRPHDLIS